MRQTKVTTLLCGPSAWALAALAGCAQQHTAPPGKGCMMDGDCGNDLVCVTGRCTESDADGSAQDLSTDLQSNGSQDAGADALPTVSIGPCGFAESEPNQDRATATPLALHADVRGCLTPGDDHDVFMVTAPPASPGVAAGGYFKAAVTNVGTGIVSARVHAPDVDNGSVRFCPGHAVRDSLYFYWAAVPGKSYPVGIHKGESSQAAPFAFTLRVDYVSVNDPFEPNDTLDTPADIAQGEPVKAYSFAGFRSSEVEPSELVDVYAVTLAPGAATIEMTDAGGVTGPSLAVFGPSQAPIVTSASQPGDRFTFDVDSPGRYLLKVEASIPRDAPFSPSGCAMNPVAVPDEFMRRYTFVVTQ